jgi:tRNA-specific 2-thiouridylase
MSNRKLQVNSYLGERMLTDVMTRVKALSLLSGGLDSILATQLILNQGIDVEAVNFMTPFCLCRKGECGATGTAKRLGVPLKVVSVGNEYLRMVRKPKHGYGRNMNPCIDCRIFMVKKAKKYAKEVGAAFIFTGEVLDERPMSQHLKAMKIIEEESGLKGRLLRPLSAKLLPETVIEKKGLVNREKLLDIRGQSRKPQIKLAQKFSISDYPCPAGGCLLTYKEFANKLRDLFRHRRRCSMADVALLKVGRHFRCGENKILVGRNETENKILTAKKVPHDYYFEVPDVGSPVTVLQGMKNKKAIEVAAALTAFYSDAKSARVAVNFGRESMNRSLIVSVPSRAEVESLRIG